MAYEAGDERPGPEGGKGDPLQEPKRPHGISHRSGCAEVGGAAAGEAGRAPQAEGSCLRAGRRYGKSGGMTASVPLILMKNCPKNGHETNEMFVRFMMQTGVDSVRNLR